ncbi:MAG: alpha/beta hydrolase [Acidimicrobiia bacterium]
MHRVVSLRSPLAAPFRWDGTNGEAFVLIHGFTGNPAHFRPLGARLHTAGYTVIAPLLPGHGGNLEDLAPVRRADWVDAALDATRQVGDHHRVHLVGLSMGGLISILLASRTKVDTLTTVNSPVVFRDRRIRFARIARFFVSEFRWPEEAPPPLDPEVAPYWIHTPGFPLIAAAELFTLSREALRAAGAVSLPSLVIQSRTDDTTHPRSGPILRRALGSASTLIWLENSMHNALFDDGRHEIEASIRKLVH